MAILAGLAAGSFSTMPYYRLPNKIPCGGRWTGKKSACPKCGYQLRPIEYVPLINWLITRGRCKSCGSEISKVYLFLELAITSLSVILFLRYGFEQIHLYLVMFALAICFVLIIAIDYTYNNIPDQLLVVILLAGFLYKAPEQIFDMLLMMVYAGLIGLTFAKIYELITKRKFTRYDYLKFLAIAGLLMTEKEFASFIIWSMVLLVILFIVNKAASRKVIPLITAFCLTFLLVYIYPQFFVIFGR